MFIVQIYCILIAIADFYLILKMYTYKDKILKRRDVHNYEVVYVYDFALYASGRMVSSASGIPKHQEEEGAFLPVELTALYRSTNKDSLPFYINAWLIGKAYFFVHLNILLYQLVSNRWPLL